MCDYSLHNVASRPAKVGDRMITTRFTNSFTRGFAPVGEPEVALCLLPGTEIAFEQDVEYGPRIDFLPSRLLGKRRIESRVARFREVNHGLHHMHHDALEFSSGETVLLTRLLEGQRATVLQLPSTTRVHAPERTSEEPVV